ncbi:hypothetical protein C8R44DRAFT_882302 [Mycena epipterygia]|nr:hypothetical protein C8R44DRAFT_882302 [Mycena epipterygia]
MHPDVLSVQSLAPLTTTVGALEIGVLFAIFCFGVLTVQVYLYFSAYPSDPCGFKLLVALVWLLDLGHTIAISHLVFTVTVTQYGDPALLVVPPKSLDAVILLSGLIGPLEQGWFTYRLYRFTKTLPLPIICAILALLRVAGSTALFAVSLKGATIQDYDLHVQWLIEAVVIVGAAVDVILAVSLCYYLSFWRKGGFERMSKLVHQLMTWTIETGALTTAGALCLLLTFLTMKDNYIYLGFFVMMAKLFSNSLLFSLNARERFARICAEARNTASVTHLTNTQFEISPLSLIPSDAGQWQEPSLASPKRPSRISFADSPPLAVRTSFLPS